jgi:uncharacterized membrane protein YjgN (DUF898 family)
MISSQSRSPYRSDQIARYSDHLWKRFRDVRLASDTLIRRSAMSKGSFQFDGGAADYLGTGLLALLITIVTLGIALPYAIVLKQRWRAKHTTVEGRRLVFIGTGVSLFLNWLKWLVLIIITLGIYSFWVAPRIHKWIVENTDWAPAGA